MRTTPPVRQHQPQRIPDLRPQNPPQNVDGEMPSKTFSTLPSGQAKSTSASTTLSSRNGSTVRIRTQARVFSPTPDRASQVRWLPNSATGKYHHRRTCIRAMGGVAPAVLPDRRQNLPQPGNEHEGTHGRDAGRPASTSHIVSMSDLLAAAENIDAVDVFFGRKVPH